MGNVNRFFFDILYRSYHPYFLRQIDVWIGMLLFVVSFLIYLKTLSPSVVSGDAGELVTTAYNMGASHPPGYPLYGIIGKLFTFLPFSNIAYRMNLFSAVSASGTVLIAYFILVKLLGFNREIAKFTLSVHGAAIAASLVFAFSKVHWSQAVIAEVYSLNVLLCAALFLIMILWYEELILNRDDIDKFWLAPRLSFLLAFCMGISITNHQIPIWYIISWAVFFFGVLFILLNFKGLIFQQQLQERTIPIVLFFLVICISVLLFVVSALKPYLLFPKIVARGQYRWIFSVHVPYIFSAILCLPVWCTIYTGLRFVFKFRENFPSYTKVAKILEIAYCTLIFGIFGMSFLFLDAYSLVVALPIFVTSLYQFLYRDIIYKKGIYNWVDDFFSILTVALWFFLFAVSIYLYLWLRAKSMLGAFGSKVFAWGDVDRLDILINHMLRNQYPRRSEDYVNVVGQIWSLIVFHAEQFSWPNLYLGLLGILYFFKREPMQAFYFVFSMFLYLFCIVYYINFQVDPRTLEIQEVFFVQQFLIYSFFIGFGYQALCDFHKFCYRKRS